jgi:hypothetical protein
VTTEAKLHYIPSAALAARSGCSVALSDGAVAFVAVSVIVADIFSSKFLLMTRISVVEMDLDEKASPSRVGVEETCPARTCMARSERGS